MNNKFLLTSLVSLVLSTNVYAEDAHEISFNELPKNVQASSLKHMVAVNIKKIEAIQDEEITKYEIESKNDGIFKSVTFAADGTVLEIEQSMQFDKLPWAAQKAVESDYPELKITEVESVQAFYFDIEGTSNSKHLELKVYASGDIEDSNDKKVDKQD